MKTLLGLTLSSILISLINSYTFSFAQLAANPNCNSTVVQQSPIDISTYNIAFFDERNFRILNTSYAVDWSLYKWQSFSTENAIGFSGNFGSMLFMKNWAMYNFNLNKIIFRAGSSAHSFNGMFFDGEIEFHHTLNDDPKLQIGRYIQATSTNLVVVVPLKVQSTNPVEKVSQLLQHLNLNQYVTTNIQNAVTGSRNIKWNTLIRHEDQYMYEGRLEFGNCDKAWYVINPKYQLFSSADYNLLVNALSNNNFISSTVPANTRPVQAVDASTVIYANTPNTTISIEASSLQYDRSMKYGMELVYLIAVLMMIFF